MFRMQRVDLEAILVRAASSTRRHARAQVRLRRVDFVEAARAPGPWTIRRRLPSGSLNILWMCVAVPDRDRDRPAAAPRRRRRAA